MKVKINKTDIILWTKEYLEKTLADYNDGMLKDDMLKDDMLKEDIITNDFKIKKFFKRIGKLLADDYCNFMYKKLKLLKNEIAINDLNEFIKELKNNKK